MSNAYGHRRTDFVPINFDLYNERPPEKTVKQMRTHMIFEAVAFVAIVVIVGVIAVFT